MNIQGVIWPALILYHMQESLGVLLPRVVRLNGDAEVAHSLDVRLINEKRHNIGAFKGWRLYHQIRARLSQKVCMHTINLEARWLAILPTTQ